MRSIHEIPRRTFIHICMTNWRHPKNYSAGLNTWESFKIFRSIFSRYKYVGGWIIIKWVFERQDGMVWTGLIWLRVGTSEGPLWTQSRTFGLHKLLGSSWVTVQLAASQEGLSSRKLDKFAVPVTVTIPYLKYLLRMRYIIEHLRCEGLGFSPVSKLDSSTIIMT
jgi:hypothetical protein